MKMSLAVILACLALGFVVTVAQGGHASTATWLAWVPLGVALIYWGAAALWSK